MAITAFVMAICDLYSDYLNDKGIEIDLPENPAKCTGAIVVFGCLCLCLVLVVAYMLRIELGIVECCQPLMGKSINQAVFNEVLTRQATRRHRRGFF